MTMGPETASRQATVDTIPLHREHDVHLTDAAGHSQGDFVLMAIEHEVGTHGEAVRQSARTSPRHQLLPDIRPHPGVEEFPGAPRRKRSGGRMTLCRTGPRGTALGDIPDSRAVHRARGRPKIRAIVRHESPWVRPRLQTSRASALRCWEHLVVMTTPHLIIRLVVWHGELHSRGVFIPPM